MIRYNEFVIHYKEFITSKTSKKKTCKVCKNIQGNFTMICCTLSHINEATSLHMNHKVMFHNNVLGASSVRTSCYEWRHTYVTYT